MFKTLLIYKQKHIKNTYNKFYPQKNQRQIILNTFDIEKIWIKNS